MARVAAAVVWVAAVEVQALERAAALAKEALPVRVEAEAAIVAVSTAAVMAMVAATAVAKAVEAAAAVVMVAVVLKVVVQLARPGTRINRIPRHRRRREPAKLPIVRRRPTPYKSRAP